MHNYYTEVHKLVCSRFGEVCSCCCLPTLSGTAWVLLKYVLYICTRIIFQAQQKGRPNRQTSHILSEARKWQSSSPLSSSSSAPCGASSGNRMTSGAHGVPHVRCLVRQGVIHKVRPHSGGGKQTRKVAHYRDRPKSMHQVA